MAVEDLIIQFIGIPALFGIGGAFLFAYRIGRRPFIVILGFIAGALVGLGRNQIIDAIKEIIK